MAGYYPPHRPWSGHRLRLPCHRNFAGIGAGRDGRRHEQPGYRRFRPVDRFIDGHLCRTALIISIHLFAFASNLPQKNARMNQSYGRFLALFAPPTSKIYFSADSCFNNCSAADANSCALASTVPSPSSREISACTPLP